MIHQEIAEEEGPGFKQIRCSIVVSISACHAEDPGSIPGRGETISKQLIEIKV